MASATRDPGGNVTTPGEATAPATCTVSSPVIGGSRCRRVTVHVLVPARGRSRVVPAAVRRFRADAGGGARPWPPPARRGATAGRAPTTRAPRSPGAPRPAAPPARRPPRATHRASRPPGPADRVRHRSDPPAQAASVRPGRRRRVRRTLWTTRRQADGVASAGATATPTAPGPTWVPTTGPMSVSSRSASSTRRSSAAHTSAARSGATAWATTTSTARPAAVSSAMVAIRSMARDQVRARSRTSTRPSIEVEHRLDLEGATDQRLRTGQSAAALEVVEGVDHHQRQRPRRGHGGPPRPPRRPCRLACATRWPASTTSPSEPPTSRLSTTSTGRSHADRAVAGEADRARQRAAAVDRHHRLDPVVDAVRVGLLEPDRRGLRGGRQLRARAASRS